MVIALNDLDHSILFLTIVGDNCDFFFLVRNLHTHSTTSKFRFRIHGSKSFRRSFKCSVKTARILYSVRTYWPLHVSFQGFLDGFRAVRLKEYLFQLSVANHVVAAALTPVLFDFVVGVDFGYSSFRS